MQERLAVTGHDMLYNAQESKIDGCTYRIYFCISALVLPMNVFRINTLKSSTQKMGGGVIGSFVGAAAGACSCGPIGFAVISTFGSVGATATAFLTNYEIPLRIIAICVLAITYFTTAKSINPECRFDS